LKRKDSFLLFIVIKTDKS